MMRWNKRLWVVVMARGVVKEELWLVNLGSDALIDRILRVNHRWLGMVMIWIDWRNRRVRTIHVLLMGNI
jgi:hypothetical protein